MEIVIGCEYEKWIWDEVEAPKGRDFESFFGMKEWKEVDFLRMKRRDLARSL